MTFAKNVEEKIAIALPLCHPDEWLAQPAVEYDRPDITNQDALTAEMQIIMSAERPPTLTGSLSQTAAPLTHRVTSARLTAISKSIPKIYIAVGDNDHLIKPNNSFWMKDQMREAELEQWRNTGMLKPF
jgi:hypothetical protein